MKTTISNKAPLFLVIHYAIMACICWALCLSLQIGRAQAADLSVDKQSLLLSERKKAKHVLNEIETASAEVGTEDGKNVGASSEPENVDVSSNEAPDFASKKASCEHSAATSSDGPATKAPKVIYKPGQSLSIGTDAEELNPTDDVDLAGKQVKKYPDSPEASFILAVALTRTSHVEEALQEVRRARKLAEGKGGPLYFDKMIATYEEMSKRFPNDNRLRYSLAWAYYMKAYLLAKYFPRPKEANDGGQQLAKPNIWASAQEIVAGKMPVNPPHIQGALERAHPMAQGEIRKYYEAALTKLDELLKLNTNDIWARVYRAFLKAEYTGNLEEAMVTWRTLQVKAPDNPAPYFFLGEGYLKQGNLKECINNISKAIALRASGK